MVISSMLKKVVKFAVRQTNIVKLFGNTAMIDQLLFDTHTLSVFFK